MQRVVLLMQRAEIWSVSRNFGNVL